MGKSANFAAMRAIWTVWKKELIDHLRDRRTVLMVFMLSVLMGPLLLVGLSYFISNVEEKAEKKEVFIVGSRTFWRDRTSPSKIPSPIFAILSKKANTMRFWWCLPNLRKNLRLAALRSNSFMTTPDKAPAHNRLAYCGKCCARSIARSLRSG